MTRKRSRIFDFHHRLSSQEQEGAAAAAATTTNKQKPKWHYGLRNKETKFSVSRGATRRLSPLIFLLGGFVLGQRDKLHDAPDDGGFDSELRGDVVHAHRAVVGAGLALVELDDLLDVLDVQGS